MQQFSATSGYAVLLFVAILAFLDIGRRLGERRLRLDPDGARTGIGAIEGAVFGLLGLLLAFTFSGAAERMAERRALIVTETNAIGTAWLRLDLLPAAQQPELRRLFRDYVDARIGYFSELTDQSAAASQSNARAQALQQRIWSQSVAAVKALPSQPAGVSVIQSLNDMIDITTTRQMALKTHPPLIIYLMLCMLMLISSLFVGFGMAGASSRNWLHSVGYALVMVGALYVIVDFEFPRLGVIRIDSVDQIMIDQRKSMEPAGDVQPEPDHLRR